MAREPAGAEKIFKSGGVANLISMMESEKDAELKLTAVRVLACLCKDSKDRVCDYSTLCMSKVSEPLCVHVYVRAGLSLY